jgi:hypothetical protein
MADVLFRRSMLHALCELHVAFHDGLHAGNGLVELPKVVVNEHASTGALDSSAHYKALSMGRQVMEQPVVIGLAIHDVDNALVGESL